MSNFKVKLNYKSYKANVRRVRNYQKKVIPTSMHRALRQAQNAVFTILKKHLAKETGIKATRLTTTKGGKKPLMVKNDPDRFSRTGKITVRRYEATIASFMSPGQKRKAVNELQKLRKLPNKKRKGKFFVKSSMWGHENKLHPSAFILPVRTSSGGENLVAVERVPGRSSKRGSNFKTRALWGPNLVSDADSNESHNLYERKMQDEYLRFLNQQLDKQIAKLR